MANIVQTAVSAGTFTMLVKAIQAADLADTLSEPGPFTVFAPNDEAFGKLPSGTMDSLLKDTPKLKSILTYHVISGKHMAQDMAKMSSEKTVEGRNISISSSRSGVKINDANVIRSDISTDNGVIHVIDRVLMPS